MARTPTTAPLKSALRVASRSTTASAAGWVQAGDARVHRRPRGTLSPEELRQLMLDEFGAWLETQVSPKTKRPYQANTIENYLWPGGVLGDWMTAQKIDGDFTECDAKTLNRFFAEYLKSHTQGGTNTLQRNMAHLFDWLQRVYGHPNPHADEALNRYAPAKARPTTLAGDFIRELLAMTGDGRARYFMDIRDHAIIRVFTEGVRLTEVTQLEVTDLAPDLIAQPGATVVPLKAAREFSKGRYVPFAPSTCRALVAYLRARNKYKGADQPWLRLSTRGGCALTSSGIYQMLKRRTRKLGYDPKSVWPHASVIPSPMTGSTAAVPKATRCGSWAGRTARWWTATPPTSKTNAPPDAKRRRGDMY